MFDRRSEQGGLRTEKSDASNRSLPDEMLAEGCCRFKLSNKPFAPLKSGIPLAQLIPAPISNGLNQRVILAIYHRQELTCEDDDTL